ncbi:zinc finger protein 883 [Galendromus occidentalis]|uniref:Zinc finger protein 883 n=1 Tax=Galendromus occidentalis TaxID=34638 RepID=A0AAJ6VXJ1_9ACAR|nr:zinc finger protein 883 [Galendromus occidentalis]
MSLMPFAKQAASKGRKSVYDSLDLEEVVVDIEYYPSDNEEEQQRNRRSPSIEDSKFGILAAATTLTSLRESRPARPSFHYPLQEQEEPRRKFNIAHLALPSKTDSRGSLNIFVKHEVVSDPISNSALLPMRFPYDSSAIDAENRVSQALQTIAEAAAASAAQAAAPAKYVITNPPIQLGQSSSTANDHSYLMSSLPVFGSYRVDTPTHVPSRSKSVSTSASESSSPCEVSSTVAENGLGLKLEESDVIFREEPVEIFPDGMPCSSSSVPSNREEQEPKFKCSKCPKVFKCHRGLQSHMKVHKRRFRYTVKPQDMHIFDEDSEDSADKDYRQPSLMGAASSLVTQTWTTDDVPSGSRAIKIEPPGDDGDATKPFACTQCFKRFSSMKGLRSHANSHNKRAGVSRTQKQPTAAAEESQIIEDNSFGEQFTMDLMEQGGDDEETGVDDLEGAGIVPGVKPEGRMFLCTLCGKRFCRRNHLVFHLRIHSGERPYPCEVCAARFSRADSLKVHMRIHTGERPYVCDICGAAFAQMINANVHRRCHTGEKPFRCEECGARFIKKDGLTVHRRIHTGEKPYSCDQCGARFAYRSCILSHYKVHNGDLLYRCEKCNAGFSLLCNLTRHKRVHAEEEAAE